MENSKFFNKEKFKFAMEMEKKYMMNGISR